MQEPGVCFVLTPSAMQRDSTLYLEAGMERSSGSPMEDSQGEETLQRPDGDPLDLCQPRGYPQQQELWQHPTGHPQRQNAWHHPQDQETSHNFMGEHQDQQHPMGDPLDLCQPKGDPQQHELWQHPTGHPQRQNAWHHPQDQETSHNFTGEHQDLQHPMGDPQEHGKLRSPMGDPKKQIALCQPMGAPLEKPNEALRLHISQAGILEGATQQPERRGFKVSGLPGHPLCQSCQDGTSMEQEDPQGDMLQKKLRALRLDEPLKKRPGFSLNKETEVHSFFRNHDVRLHFTDIRYPEPLATEESPRRRSRSLPWNTIPEVDMEEEEDSIMCCCKLKKKVQFADSLGLTLASVKHFFPSEDPLVPQAVLARLQSYPPTVYGQKTELILEDELTASNLAEEVMPTPAELLERLNETGVCLEQVSCSSLGVRGYVLVKNPGETAQVKIRYTFNEWLSFLDCPATLVGQSSTLLPSSGCQRFHFNLCYPPSTSAIHFAICSSSEHGQEMWDNNKGANYTVTCHQDPIPDIQPSSPEQEDWEGSLLW